MFQLFTIPYACCCQQKPWIGISKRCIQHSYSLFFFIRTSFSRLALANLFLYLHRCGLAIPVAEKVHSTGADEAGVAIKSIANGGSILREDLDQ